MESNSKPNLIMIAGCHTSSTEFYDHIRKKTTYKLSVNLPSFLLRGVIVELYENEKS